MHENAHVSAEASGPSLLAKAVGLLGLALHLLLLPLIFTSGLIAPQWGVTVIILGWVALLIVGLRMWRTSPVLIILIPIAGAVWWLAALSAGGTFLGWQA